MIKQIKTSIFLVSLVILPAAHARAEADPLWSKTMSQYKLTNQWVPKEIRTQINAERKDQPDKTAYIKSTLNGWEKQEPKYTSATTDSNWQILPEQQKSADGTNKMLTGLDELKSSLLEGGVKVKRLNNESQDGKNLAVFQLSDDGAGMKIDIKIWVNPDTACMVKMDTSMHVAFFADADFSTRYTEPGKEGLCFREKMQGNIDIQIPFKKAKMSIKQNHADWTPKPVN
ncbi:hypothetical protein ACO0LM_17960 [Undibacterium sp. Di26W]|uniref:hypothetical protein n=1 Tax=Undibacterium sp. Di26W TaxID=3413035 RepID=UPI003BF0CAD4